MDGHLEGFRKSADFPPFLQAVRSFYHDIKKMLHYEVTAVYFLVNQKINSPQT